MKSIVSRVAETFVAIVSLLLSFLTVVKITTQSMERNNLCQQNALMRYRRNMTIIQDEIEYIIHGCISNNKHIMTRTLWRHYVQFTFNSFHNIRNIYKINIFIKLKILFDRSAKTCANVGTLWVNVSASRCKGFPTASKRSLWVLMD